MASPASLDSPSLARRLGELASDERHVQVDFLLHLDEFDRRRAWLELGYGSRSHNGLHAEQVYGVEHMRKSRKGESTVDVGSAGGPAAGSEARDAG